MTTPPAIETAAALTGVPLCATPAWLAAVTAAGGYCQCAGQCGRKHKATAGRCTESQGRNGIILHLTGTGAVYCPPCDLGQANAAARAVAKAAPAEVAGQGDLFDLLGR